MINDTMTIIRDRQQDYIPIPLPGAEGVAIKVLKVDAPSRRVVAKVKFAPGSRMPRHLHHCRAVAYTMSGEWAYDEGSFSTGDAAVEQVGNVHTPWSDTGTEMFLVFDGDDKGNFLDNYLDDGTVIRIGLPLLQALEGISLAEASAMDILQLVDIIPPAA